MANFLQKCVRAILCCLGFITNTGKYRKSRKNTKNVCKIREKYKNYNDALKILNLDTLEDRRTELTKRFAMNGIMSNTLNDLFPRNDPKHKMERRKKEKFKVNFANTERLKNASVITMQNLLNQENND